MGLRTCLGLLWACATLSAKEPSGTVAITAPLARARAEAASLEKRAAEARHQVERLEALETAVAPDAVSLAQLAESPPTAAHCTVQEAFRVLEENGVTAWRNPALDPANAGDPVRESAIPHRALGRLLAPQGPAGEAMSLGEPRLASTVNSAIAQIVVEEVSKQCGNPTHPVGGTSALSHGSYPSPYQGIRTPCKFSTRANCVGREHLTLDIKRNQCAAMDARPGRFCSIADFRRFAAASSYCKRAKDKGMKDPYQVCLTLDKKNPEATGSCIPNFMISYVDSDDPAGIKLYEAQKKANMDERSYRAFSLRELIHQTCSGVCKTETGCKCMDGVHIQMFQQRQTRYDFATVMMYFLHVFNVISSGACRVPPRGCAWREMGYKPEGGGLGTASSGKCDSYARPDIAECSKGEGRRRLTHSKNLGEGWGLMKAKAKSAREATLGQIGTKAKNAGRQLVLKLLRKAIGVIPGQEEEDAKCGHVRKQQEANPKFDWLSQCNSENGPMRRKPVCDDKMIQCQSEFKHIKGLLLDTLDAVSNAAKTVESTSALLAVGKAYMKCRLPGVVHRTIPLVIIKYLFDRVSRLCCQAFVFSLGLCVFVQHLKSEVRYQGVLDYDPRGAYQRTCATLRSIVAPQEISLVAFSREEYNGWNEGWYYIQKERPLRPEAVAYFLK